MPTSGASTAAAASEHVGRVDSGGRVDAYTGRVCGTGRGLRERPRNPRQRRAHEAGRRASGFPARGKRHGDLENLAVTGTARKKMWQTGRLAQQTSQPRESHVSAVLSSYSPTMLFTRLFLVLS